MRLFFAIGLVIGLIVRVSAQIPIGYYDAAEGLNGAALKNALNDIISGHTTISYDNVTNALRSLDEDSLNTDNVICIYTSWSYPKTSFGNGGNQWNREHVWSKSHSDFGDNPPSGTDLHHMRPEDASVNSAKNNRDFDEAATQYIDGSGPTPCYYSTNIWEPRESVKGDVARMLFYMATRYEGENGEVNLELVDYTFSSPNNEPYYAKLSTLLQWHENDPVDVWERRRNDGVYAIQGNRNPFIDHPEFVNRVWNPEIASEPANYAANFSGKSILLEWVDAQAGVLPDGYLVRMSNSGFSAIESPVDGMAVANDINNKNVAFGVQKVAFSGLEEGQVFYFKIFAFKGSGVSIKYKTDGLIPQTSQMAQ